MGGPRGEEGIVKCIVPEGKKSGPTKGAGYERVIGIGEKPGDEYAALNALHQVERGKPLERLLAPEFREVWLDMDRRYAEAEKAKSRAAFVAEKKRKAEEKRAKAAKTAEAGTISISTASRQIIEDALLETRGASNESVALGQGKSTSDAPGGSVSRQGAGTGTAPTPESTENASNSADVKSKLISFGFAALDADSASARFENVEDALDYLCLNLDESELPASFAPTSDVEVVQFQKGTSQATSVRVDTALAQKLADVLCCSRLASEKALRECDGDAHGALARLYESLTGVSIDRVGDSAAQETGEEKGSSERDLESEALEAIYGADFKAGVGAVSGFPSAWGAKLRLSGGIPAFRVTQAISLCLVDPYGTYPYSGAVLYVEAKDRVLSRSQRRATLRGIAHEVSKARGAESDEAEVPTHLMHIAASFAASATDGELLEAAAACRPAFASQGSTDRRTTMKSHTPASSSSRTADSHGSATRSQERSRASTKLPIIQKPRPLPGNSGRVVSPKLDAARKAMAQKRAGLPAHEARGTILDAIRGNQVTVVSGATGSGKTTQVPQFLLEEAGQTGKPIAVVCTQPRRIAAMSVAERVAAERCESIGESVGFQVKLNVKRSSSTRLLFCTTGVLLRRMQSDPTLESLTHVLVDECHERSVDTDFLLLLVREILPQRPNLRVVLMSATLDATKFASYFSSITGALVPVISIPGRTFPVDDFYLESIVQQTGYRIRPGDKFAKKQRGPKGVSQVSVAPSAPVDVNSASAAARADDPASSDEQGSETELPDSWEDDSDSAEEGVDIGSRGVPRDDAGAKETVKLLDDSLVNYDLIEKLVRHIDTRMNDDSKGAVLIFLPGIAEISTTIERLSRGPGSSRLAPMPLHSALSPDEQTAVFSRPAKGRRKVICSTNIAETSVTVEDVTVVIDTIRVKEMTFDALNGTSVLAETFASRAAARQRSGRAGRVSKGTCYRLVKRSTFENVLADQQEPEIRRVSLEHLILNMLCVVPAAEGANDPQEFLGKAMDPPSPTAIGAAVSNLKAIGALKEETAAPVSKDSRRLNVSLTALGRHLAGIPVDARIGKMLVFGSLFGCLDASLTIGATLSERSPFFSPRDKREESRQARANFAWGKSDLLLAVKAYDAFAKLRSDRAGYHAEIEFCERSFLSRKTLLAIGDAKRQLRSAIADAGFDVAGAEANSNNANLRVLRAVICAALYPNVIRIDPPDTKYTGVASGAIPKAWNAKELRMRSKDGQRVFLHPESVNFDEGGYENRWLAYFSKVQTSRVFVRDSTMVSAYAILLFGGGIEVKHAQEQLAVDGWVIFKSPARVAVLVRELRRNLDALLQRKFEEPGLDLATAGKSVTDAILRLIKTES